MGKCFSCFKTQKHEYTDMPIKTNTNVEKNKKRSFSMNFLRWRKHPAPINKCFTEIDHLVLESQRL